MFDYRLLPPPKSREIYWEISEEFKKIAGAQGLLEKEVICRVVPRGLGPLPREISLADAAETYFDVLSKKESLTTGKDLVIRCSFEGHCGESSTDAPRPYRGRILDVVDLLFSKDSDRAIFFAVLNAVYNYLGLVHGTVKCSGDEPKKCGKQLAEHITKNFGKNAIVAQIGYKAEHVQACSKFKGYVSEVKSEYVGKVKFGKKIISGAKNEELIKKADVACIAGSSLVNGTLPRLLYLCEIHGTEPVMYGITAAAASRILNLTHFCPFANKRPATR